MPEILGLMLGLPDILGISGLPDILGICWSPHTNRSSSARFTGPQFLVNNLNAKWEHCKMLGSDEKWEDAQ